MKIISEHDLRLYNGEDNERMHVAYKGTIYYVTDCPKWRRGLHENQYFPGQDLTYELDHEAPHTGGVFSHPCLEIVGRLLE
jgi:predicted heme/steroid binding protein